MTTKDYNGRINRIDAVKIVKEFTYSISGLCANIEICGPIRRGEDRAKDADLVIIPNNPHRLLARLDKLVIEGKIAPTVKSDGKKRWGSRYRAITLNGLDIELYLADQHNLGYQTVLRTGPADGNKLIMQRIQHSTGCAFKSGYVWRDERKISVPDEATMFRILRMREIPVHMRGLLAYNANYLHLPKVKDHELTFVDEPQNSIGHS